MEQLLSAETIGLIIERAGLSILLFGLLWYQLRQSSTERKDLLKEASAERQAMIVAIVEISKIVEALKQSIQISNETDARSAESLRQNTLELGGLKAAEERLIKIVGDFHKEYNRRNEDIRDMVYRQFSEIHTELVGLKTQHNIFAKHHIREEKGLYKIWQELNAIKKAGASIGGAD